jgi:hypothetical protein
MAAAQAGQVMPRTCATTRLTPCGAGAAVGGGDVQAAMTAMAAAAPSTPTRCLSDT